MINNFIVTQALAREYFDYLPETGQLVWIKSKNSRAPVGKVVGEWKSTNRKNVQFFKRKFYVYQLIYLWHYGYVPKEMDHKDRDKNNNRIENLRECNSTQNAANRKFRNKSGYKGVVHLGTKKYRAAISINGRTYHLGLFKTIEEAAKAYDVIAFEWYGEFAHLNLPPSL